MEKNKPDESNRQNMNGKNDDSGFTPPDNPNPKNKGKSPKGPNIFNIIIVVFLINFLLNLLLTGLSRNSTIQIEYSGFLRLLEKGLVDRVELDDEFIVIALKPDADPEAVESVLYPAGVADPRQAAPRQPAPAATDLRYATVRMDDPELVGRLNANGVNFYKKYDSSRNSPILGFITSWIIPVLLMYLAYHFFIRKMLERMGAGGGMGGMMGIGKSKAKEYAYEKSTGVKFSHVAGQDEAKESLAELVDYLHNPQKYREIGAKQPKGALLVGPPGTGKTLLAKALAGEAGVPFYSISGSEFVEMFVGVGASRVRDLFEQAKKNSPCIIFIDEIDAIGKSRDVQFGGNDEREQTLNQLLSEMDGFAGNNGIVVLAATNRPEILDKALLRPGRFDRRIIVEKPDLIGREAILKVHSKNVKMDDNVNLREIALLTSGASGADLANIVNEGALLAVKEGRKTVTQPDLMEAVEVVIAGKEKKDRIMSPAERQRVAYHEVGHALVSALLKNSQPVQKITIVPRTMGSLGYTMNMPEEERYLMTKDEVLDQITTLLGGRAAEIVQFDMISTGASNDIERATALARSMVTQYGMSGKFGPMGLESVESKYLDGRAVSNCSPDTSAAVDGEVRDILADCQQKAVDLLRGRTSDMIKIADTLLEKENITGEEFMGLLGGRSE